MSDACKHRITSSERREATGECDVTAKPALSDQCRDPRPEEALRQTVPALGEPVDAADQAKRLRLVMEAEAVDEGCTKGSGIGVDPHDEDDSQGPTPS